MPAGIAPATCCGGAAAPAGAPAPSGGGAMGAPGSAPVADAHAGHDHVGQAPPGHAGRAPGGGGHDHAAGAGGEHSAHVVQRTAPVDEARARKNLSAVMEMFAKAKRSQFEFKADKPNATHGRLTPKLIAEFQKRFPGLPVPHAVVFDNKTGAPTGVVYTDAKAPPELGMGTSHRHREGSKYMQHIWFTPDDLQLAFSDVTRKKDVKHAVLGGAGGGGPAPGK